MDRHPASGSFLLFEVMAFAVTFCLFPNGQKTAALISITLSSLIFHKNSRVDAPCRFFVSSKSAKQTITSRVLSFPVGVYVSDFHLSLSKTPNKSSKPVQLAIVSWLQFLLSRLGCSLSAEVPLIP
jgi:hypothetical protein